MQSEQSPLMCNVIQRSFAPFYNTSNLSKIELFSAELHRSCVTGSNPITHVIEKYLQNAITFNFSFRGWTLFMPRWQLGVHARTSLGQCVVGRGDISLLRLREKFMHYVIDLCLCYNDKPVSLLNHIIYYSVHTNRTNPRGDAEIWSSTNYFASG